MERASGVRENKKRPCVDAARGFGFFLLQEMRERIGCNMQSPNRIAIRYMTPLSSVPERLHVVPPVIRRSTRAPSVGNWLVILF
jgi:hypothetical protein